MRVVPKLIIFSALLALAGCGKDNESGKSKVPNHASNPICVQMGPNGQCAQYSQVQMNSNSPYSYNGVSLNQVQAENPCILSSSWGQSNMQRTVIQQQVNIGTIIVQGDMYVGVTSYGDVAAIIGNGTANPTFVAYMCPRPTGQGILYPQITIGAYTNCAVKYITAANVNFPDGSQANFRAPSPGGSSQRQKFSFCQQ